MVIGFTKVYHWNWKTILVIFITCLNSFDFCLTLGRPALNECRAKVSQKLEEVFKRFWHNFHSSKSFRFLSAFSTKSHTCSNSPKICLTKLSREKSGKRQNCLNGPLQYSNCCFFLSDHLYSVTMSVKSCLN